MMFSEMGRAGLYPPQYRESSGAAGDCVTVVLLNDPRLPLWDLVNDWIDRNGPIDNAAVCRLGKLDTVRASRMLKKWTELGLLRVLEGRNRRDTVYTKLGVAEHSEGPFSGSIENGSFLNE